MSNTETQPIQKHDFRIARGFSDSDFGDLATEDGIVTPEFIDDEVEVIGAPGEEVRDQYRVVAKGYKAIDDFMAADMGHGIGHLYEAGVELAHERDEIRKRLSQAESGDSTKDQSPGFKDRAVSKLGRLIPRRKKEDIEASVGVKFNKIPVEVSPIHLVEDREAVIDETQTEK